MQTNTKKKCIILMEKLKKESRKDGEIKPLNVLNVFSSRYGMCIEQEMIEEKTNEITANRKAKFKRSNMYMGCPKYTKRKCKSSNIKRRRLLCSIKSKSRKFLYRRTRLF